MVKNNYWKFQQMHHCLALPSFLPLSFPSFVIMCINSQICLYVHACVLTNIRVSSVLVLDMYFPIFYGKVSSSIFLVWVCCSLKTLIILLNLFTFPESYFLSILLCVEWWGKGNKKVCFMHLKLNLWSNKVEKKPHISSNSYVPTGFFKNLTCFKYTVYHITVLKRGWYYWIITSVLRTAHLSLLIQQLRNMCLTSVGAMGQHEVACA